MSLRKKNRRLQAELFAEKFYPTVDACNYWYSIINDEVFGNKLSPVTIRVQRMRGMWGFYHDEESYLGMNDIFPGKNFFLNVLAHEMIHAFQHQQGLIVNHGKTFWDWRKKFTSNGLSLAISYDGRSRKDYG